MKTILIVISLIGAAIMSMAAFDFLKKPLLIQSLESKTAQFFQLPAGPLEWSEDLIKQKISFKVSCFTCHSNGLRAIRPAAASFAEKMKVHVWNFKIKSYGRISEDPTHSATDQLAKFPFRHKEKFENDTLKVKTCILCHKESGFGARGPLTRQNSVAIKFMIEGGFMPPFGIPLSNSEKSEIYKFIRGF